MILVPVKPSAFEMMLESIYKSFADSKEPVSFYCEIKRKMCNTALNQHCGDCPLKRYQK
jgi:hypothetical protein